VVVQVVKYTTSLTTRMPTGVPTPRPSRRNVVSNATRPRPNAAHGAVRSTAVLFICVILFLCGTSDKSGRV
jgi:hypothetical protein